MQNDSEESSKNKRTVIIHLKSIDTKMLVTLANELKVFMNDFSNIMGQANIDDPQKTAEAIGTLLDNKFQEIGNFIKENFLQSNTEQDSFKNCKELIIRNASKSYAAIKDCLKTNAAFQVNLKESIKVALALMQGLTALGLVFSSPGIALSSTTTALVNNLFNTAYYTSIYILSSTMWGQIILNPEVQKQHLDDTIKALQSNIKDLKDILEQAKNKKSFTDLPMDKTYGALNEIYVCLHSLLKPTASHAPDG